MAVCYIYIKQKEEIRVLLPVSLTATYGISIDFFSS